MVSRFICAVEIELRALDSALMPFSCAVIYDGKWGARRQCTVQLTGLQLAMGTDRAALVNSSQTQARTVTSSMP
jgi:hypothetical protein